MPDTPNVTPFAPQELNRRDFMRGAALAVAGIAASVGAIAVARRPKAARDPIGPDRLHLSPAH